MVMKARGDCMMEVGREFTTPLVTSSTDILTENGHSGCDLQMV